MISSRNTCGPYCYFWCMLTTDQDSTFEDDGMHLTEWKQDVSASASSSAEKTSWCQVYSWSCAGIRRDGLRHCDITFGWYTGLSNSLNESIQLNKLCCPGDLCHDGSIIIGFWRSTTMYLWNDKVNHMNKMGHVDIKQMKLSLGPNEFNEL